MTESSVEDLAGRLSHHFRRIFRCGAVPLREIKPDLVCWWDEAWFALARFHPVYRHRHAGRLHTLIERDRLPEQRAQYDKFADEVGAIDAADDEVLLERRLLPDPARVRVRVRVYSTQSTHKTLTSLRQGSMINVADQDFSQKAEETFHEAYMTHTLTSPNWRWRVSSWSRSRSRTRCGSATRSMITRCWVNTCAARLRILRIPHVGRGGAGARLPARSRLPRLHRQALEIAVSQEPIERNIPREQK